MPSRSRQATATPATPASAARRPRSPGSAATPSAQQTVPLPEYQPPSHPLTAEARDALQALSREYPGQKLIAQYRDAQERLTDRAGEINEELLDVQTAAEKRRLKRARDGAAPDPDEENRARTDVDRIEKMTARMEATLRRTIDSQAAVDALATSLREIPHNAVAASQTQSSRVTVEPESDAAAGPPPALVPRLEAALQAHADRHDAQTLAARYADNNAYIGFKTHVHESRHSEGAPPLAPRARWFAAPPPAPGETAPAEEEDDDDVAIARETVSTKCPLTLREFADPVTSTRCPHSFERAAILDLIARARRPVDARGRPARDTAWVPHVQCPVVGCAQRLARADLEANPVVVRRVRRIQRLNRVRAEMADDDDDGARRGEFIESDDDEGVDDAAGRRPALVVKRERLRSTMGEDIQDDGFER